MSDVVATASGLISGVSETTFMSQINFWVSLLGTFSSILLGIFAVLALILGFLTWKQNKMREDAEIEMRRIVKIREDMDKLSLSYYQLMDKSKDMLKSVENLLKNTSAEAKRVGQLATQLEEKGSKVKAISEEINEIQESLAVNMKSLATVSASMSPSKFPSLLDYLRNSDREGGASIYSIEDIRKAREILSDQGNK